MAVAPDSGRNINYMLKHVLGGATPNKPGAPRNPSPERPSDISSPGYSALTTGPGSLDPTFGTGGKLTTDFSSSELASANAVQADGKIVVAGGFNNGVNYDFAVFRYNPDGSLDTSFDADGKVITSVGNSQDFADAVAIQADGKIIAAGHSSIDGVSSGFALVRYNTDGSLDPSFGTGGIVTSAFGYGFIYDIAIQGDGKIVAAGSSYNDTTYQDFTLARYNSNGTLDTSFDGDGKLTTDFDNFYEYATGVAIQADGKIVAAGSRDDGDFGFSSYALARYNADGSLDTSFDTDGKVITTFDGSSAANAVAMQTDGKIVAAGYSASCYIFNCAAPDFAVVRYNTNGSLDTSFDSDGKVITNFGGADVALAVAIQTNGKIVASGHATNNSIFDFALARYNSDGSPDTSFGADGKITTDFGNFEVALDVAVQADGKIVSAGYSRNHSNYDFALSRYNAEGSLDASFDTDGKVTTSVIVASSGATAVATQLSGSITIAGYRNRSSNEDFAVAQYGDGYPDYSFSTDGKVTTDFAGGNDRANAVAVQRDGKTVVAGYANYGLNSDFALARYNVDGSLDTSYDADGKVMTDFGGDLDSANAIAIQTDGKIVAAGVGASAVTGYGFALVRYNTDGLLDSTFDSDGKVTSDFGNSDAAYSVAIQTDGKIVAVGIGDSEGNGIPSFALARYNTDGSLDTTFDTDGKVTTVFGAGLASARSVALQPDGRIVAAGTSAAGFALARYNLNGSLDVSFDADGRVTTPIGGAAGVAIQLNGKIIAAGFDDSDFVLARYNRNGSLDNSFDADGKLTTNFGGDDQANAVAIQRDGRIIAVGSASSGAITHFAAAGYVGDPVRTKFDYDGDGRSDVSVFRPSMLNNGSWFVRRSSNGTTEQFHPGFPQADKIVPADYDGDGKTDIAQFNSTTGTWYIMRPGAPNITFRFGASGDIPVPSDYDGDGKADIAVYRPSTGTWWILQSGDGAVLIQRFGLSEDKPVAGDYDGDGRSDIAVYRPSDGVWYLLQSTAGFTAMHFGIAEDKPTTGDYDGDGKSDLAVFRPSTNIWYVLRSTNASFFAVQFGLAADIPAPGDYDGDGKHDIAVFRPANGYWYVLQSSNGNTSYQHFGLAGDVPTPSAFLPQ